MKSLYPYNFAFLSRLFSLSRSATPTDAHHAPLQPTPMTFLERFLFCIDEMNGVFLWFFVLF